MEEALCILTAIIFHQDLFRTYISCYTGGSSLAQCSRLIKSQSQRYSTDLFVSCNMEKILTRLPFPPPSSLRKSSSLGFDGSKDVKKGSQRGAGQDLAATSRGRIGIIGELVPEC